MVAAPRADRAHRVAPALPRPRLGAGPDRLDRGRDLRDPLRVGHGHRAHLAGADRGADPGRGRARLGDARSQAAGRARGDPAVRRSPGPTKDSLAGEAAGALLSALSCVTLGRAARRGDPAGLAEGRDRADGRRRRLARGLGPAAGARTRRWSPPHPPAGLPQLQAEMLRHGLDGLRRPVRRRAARRGAGRAVRRQLAGGAADARPRGACSTCCSSSRRAAGDRAGRAGADRDRGVASRRQCVRSRRRRPSMRADAIPRQAR